MIVTAEAYEAWRRLAPHYEGVQRRWQAYLERLSEDQVRFAVKLFSAAAEINEIEIMNLAHGT